MPPILCPDSSAIYATTRKIVLQAHPKIASNLTPEQVSKSNTGILHASLSDAPTITFHYWIKTRSTILALSIDLQEAGYYIIYFNPFSTKATCIRLHPDQTITNMISARLTETSPSTIPSLSLMSTLPSPLTSPTNTLRLNSPANPTTALLALMHQMLQQNATTMTHFQEKYYSPSIPTTPIAPSYKIKCPPFPKWDGTPTTKPLFLAQFATYKLESYYSGMKYWKNTTPDNKHLNTATSADMLEYLPFSISSMFFNDTRFALYGISMILHLITRLNPSSRKTTPLPFHISLDLIWDYSRQVWTNFPASAASHNT